MILGTLPGDTSLALGEYYGHPRNRFWRIVSHLAGTGLPTDYNAKKELLYQTGIGVWDVARQAVRKGSLDQAILQEVPNDLEAFFAKHDRLETVGFNGQKAEKLYDRYFRRHPDLRYVSLPSTSPANAAASFETLSRTWEKSLFNF